MPSASTCPPSVSGRAVARDSGPLTRTSEPVATSYRFLAAARAEVGGGGWAIRGRARPAPATDARDETYLMVLPLNARSAADRSLVRQLGEVVDAPEDVVDRHAVVAAVPRHIEAG